MPSLTVPDWIKKRYGNLLEPPAKLPEAVLLDCMQEGYLTAKQYGFAYANTCPYAPAIVGNGNEKVHAWYRGFWFYGYWIRPLKETLK